MPPAQTEFPNPETPIPVSPRQATGSSEDFLSRNELGLATLILGNTRSDFAFPNLLDIRVRLSLNRLHKLLGQLRAFFKRQAPGLLGEFIKKG